jgi:hypothetical protein
LRSGINASTADLYVGREIIAKALSELIVQSLHTFGRCTIATETAQSHCIYLYTLIDGFQQAGQSVALTGGRAEMQGHLRLHAVAPKPSLAV